MDRPQWSYSQIAQYLRCPLQYYFRRILGLKEEAVSHQLALGSAVHEALAHYHRSLQQGPSSNQGQVREAFRHAWHQRKEKDRIDIPADKTEEEVLGQGETLLNAYLEEAPPQHIVGVEQSMLVPIVTSQGDVLEKPLLAIADLITRDQTGIRVHDFKTSSRTYSEFEATTSLQATCYVTAAKSAFGETPSFRYTVLIKTKKPRVQHLDTTRSEVECGRLGDLIQVIERALASGIFYPVESPLNCSGCSYRRPCLEWGTSDKPEGLIQLGVPGKAVPCSSSFTKKAEPFVSLPGREPYAARFSSGRPARM